MEATRVNNDTHIPVATGELIDKITILQIKTRRIVDPDKLVNIHRELGLLHQIFDDRVDSSSALLELMDQLRAINESLWTIEDAIRDCETGQDFGPRFINLARAVYQTNDRRCAVKRQINLLTGSALIEEKSYRSSASAPRPLADR